MEKKHVIFIIGMKFRVSEKIMRPYVTLLNIFSEIAHLLKMLRLIVKLTYLTGTKAKMPSQRNI